MQPTVLITLGRLPKGLDLARSFRRLGWRVIVAEPFRWHLSAMSNAVARRYTVTAPAIDRERYLGELCDIVMKEGVELVVPVSEEIMHVSHLAGRLPRPTFSAVAAGRATDDWLDDETVKELSAGLALLEDEWSAFA